MESSYLSTQPVATPWRTAALVAGAVAAVELFMLVVAGVVLGAKLTSDHAERAISPPGAAKPAFTTPSGKAGARAATSRSTPTPAAAATLPRDRTSIIVLNGNGVSGAAALVADQVRRFHYIIAATGNAPRTDFQHSLVMYRPGLKGEAIRLAHDLHLRRVTPLDGLTRRDLQGAHLALIIGG